MAEQNSYDEMPYIDRAFSQTHPNRLATIARMFGLQPPDVGTSRVLELGCASGSNIIPMALGLPNARFIGIDLSVRQIDEGQRQIRALGLTNIELRQQDIAGVDASWGKFDYIVGHGIYSWVPAPVRERILSICRENLAPAGVAYVSYNSLPGWHIRGMLRDMMLYHSSQFQGATTRIREARGLLDFLAESAPTATAYGMVLRQEVDIIRHKEDAYLFHDYLEDVNEPFYFYEFAEAARRHGLDYLGEADFGDMLASNLPPQAAETLKRIATDIIRMEQYMDFVRNRMFRQTLLVHEGAPIRRKLDGRVLKGLLVESVLQPVSTQPSLRQGVSEKFRAPDGTVHELGDALTKAALVLLARQWPHCLTFEELAAMSRAAVQQRSGNAGGAEMPADDDQSFGDRLLRGYAARAVAFRVAAPLLARTPSARPVASPLARLQAAKDPAVTNLRHESVTLHELLRRLLPVLDGTRDIDALVGHVVKLAQEGNVEVREHEGGPVVTDPAAMERIMRRAVEVDLEELARISLLME